MTSKKWPSHHIQGIRDLGRIPKHSSLFWWVPRCLRSQYTKSSSSIKTPDPKKRQGSCSFLSESSIIQMLKFLESLDSYLFSPLLLLCLLFCLLRVLHQYSTRVLISLYQGLKLFPLNGVTENYSSWSFHWGFSFYYYAFNFKTTYFNLWMLFSWWHSIFYLNNGIASLISLIIVFLFIF